jgi:predicted nucleic acid-binding protein
MNLVLDASAGIEVVLRRAKAMSIISLLHDADWVIAPDLYMAEAANTFWKFHNLSDVPLDRCEKGLEETIAMIDTFFGSKDLFRESFGLACITRHPVYDMLYCIVARRNNAQLVTLDTRLQKLAVKHGIKVAVL